jgi:hypothetical protein
VFGARPLKRAIQQHIENPLAKQILEGKFAFASPVRRARSASRRPDSQSGWRQRTRPRRVVSCPRSRSIQAGLSTKTTAYVDHIPVARR